MTWDWTQAPRTIGEHSNHSTNEPVINYLKSFVYQLWVLDKNTWCHINV